MRIAAFDLSLTSTGVARHTPPGDDLPIVTGALRCRDKGAERLVAVRSLVLSELRPLGTYDLVVVEGYAFGRPNQAHFIGELGGVVRVALFEAGQAFMVVPPASVKKYATGKGNATKEVVMGAAVHRAGREFESTDEADAWWLLQMACAHYGLEHVEMPGKNREALEAVEWPTIKGATE